MSSSKSQRNFQIKNDILQEFQWTGHVSPAEVGVVVEGGTVTLTGTVDGYAKKIAAETAAHRIAGVTDVANDIQVSVPHATTTDSEIAQAVRDALERDAFVPHRRIQSTVAMGLITLTGVVDRWAERSEAERAVARLVGVRGVTNRIEVAPAHDPDLGVVENHIQTALSRLAQHEGKRVTVDVHDGQVTLSGHVRSWAARQAIVETVGHAPGIRMVHDRIAVDPDVTRDREPERYRRFIEQILIAMGREDIAVKEVAHGTPTLSVSFVHGTQRETVAVPVNELQDHQRARAAIRRAILNLTKKVEQESIATSPPRGAGA